MLWTVWHHIGGADGCIHSLEYQRRQRLTVHQEVWRSQVQVELEGFHASVRQVLQTLFRVQGRAGM